MNNPLDPITLLRTNLRHWLAGDVGLPEIAALLSEIQDALIARKCPGAGLVAQAEIVVRRQADAAAAVKQGVPR